MKRFAALIMVGILVPAAANAVDTPIAGDFQAPMIGFEPAGSCLGDVKYSQLPLWENGAASQDETAAGCPDGVEAAAADDFPGGGGPTSAVRFWGITNGSFFNETSFRIAVYDDTGNCLPTEAARYVAEVPASNTAVDGFPGLPSWEHCAELAEPFDNGDGGWLSCVALYCRANGDVSDGQWFWADHTFANGCPLAFRSAFFGFPTWVTGAAVFGADLDNAFEKLTNGGTPTEESSWGELKDLYR